jgi:hypothetical protein
MQKWTSLLFPFLIGAFGIAIAQRQMAGQVGEALEGAFWVLGLASLMSLVVVFPLAFTLAAKIATAYQPQFPEFLAAVFCATLPVAYLQAFYVNVSLMPEFWGLVRLIPHTNINMASRLWDSVTYSIVFLVTALAVFRNTRKKTNAETP